MKRHLHRADAWRCVFAHGPTQAVAILALAAALLAGPLTALAANPVSPREATSEIGGQFTLVDQDGRNATDAQFRGKWLLVYFGYTHCPDACPTALNDMAEALDRLDPARREKVQVVFITVDPQRDTPAVMKDYVGAFEDANIIGLTGTPEQVSVAEAAYRIRARRYDRADGDYAMSHAATIDIMGPDGRFVAMARPEHIAERLAQLVP
jgi:cytochrome oxidase Cu insertion factor (SCO1/SenC/PrrC family)